MEKRHLAGMSALAWWLLAAVSLQAGGLKWQEPVISIEAGPADKSATASFAFTNTSAKVVEIRKVKTSCGCTTAEVVGGQTIAPGKSGTLKVVFAFGDRKGLQEKIIVVEQADGARDLLKLRVNIPQAVAVSPRQLTWPAEAPRSVQAVEVKLSDLAAKFQGATVVGEGFAVSTEVVEEGRAYRVNVKPVDPAAAARATLRLEIADPNPRSIFVKLASGPPEKSPEKSGESGVPR